MPNNLKNVQDIDAAPAQMVGGMRVKNPDPNRTPLKQDDKTERNNEENEEDEGQVLDSNETNVRALKERQAQDMHSHTASRQHDIPKNPGNNPKQIFSAPYQQRSMNH